MKNNKKKYTVKYFKDGLPEWKRIKDPFTTRIFYRPLSFVTSCVASNLGITANQVSYFSILIAITACVMLIIPNYVCNIIGAICTNLWLLSDCTDGNIARSVKKQPFGDFADSISSYTLVAFLGVSLGITAFLNGGLLIDKGCIWIVLLGSLASTGDTLMRLIYQKYKSSERKLADDGILDIEVDKRTLNSETNSILVRIESDYGIGGILPLIVLFGVLFKITDLVVIYCFIYYFFAGIAMSSKYIIKAIRRTSDYEKRKK